MPGKNNNSNNKIVVTCENTVAGSWFGSPTRTQCLQPNLKDNNTKRCRQKYTGDQNHRNRRATTEWGRNRARNENENEKGERDEGTRKSTVTTLL